MIPSQTIMMKRTTVKRVSGKDSLILTNLIMHISSDSCSLKVQKRITLSAYITNSLLSYQRCYVRSLVIFILTVYHCHSVKLSLCYLIYYISATCSHVYDRPCAILLHLYINMSLKEKKNVTSIRKSISELKLVLVLIFSNLAFFKLNKLY